MRLTMRRCRSASTSAWPMAFTRFGPTLLADAPCSLKCPVSQKPNQARWRPPTAPGSRAGRYFGRRQRGTPRSCARGSTPGGGRCPKVALNTLVPQLKARKSINLDPALLELEGSLSAVAVVVAQSLGQPLPEASLAALAAEDEALAAKHRDLPPSGRVSHRLEHQSGCRYRDVPRPHAPTLGVDATGRIGRGP